MTGAYKCNLSEIAKVEVGEHIINGLGMLILTHRDVDELSKCPEDATLHLVNVTVSYEHLHRYRIMEIIPFRRAR